MVAAPAGDEAPPAHVQRLRAHPRRARRRSSGVSLLGDTVDKRKPSPASTRDRADIILAGAIILEQVMDVLRHRASSSSRSYALREGVLLDAVPASPRRDAAPPRATSRRRSVVLHLAELMRRRARALARRSPRSPLELFDATADAARPRRRRPASTARGRRRCWPTSGCSSPTRKHHLHTYYVIRNTEHLTGFTDHEIEIIAQVARYHRKSAPQAEARRVRRASGPTTRTGARAGRHPARGDRPRPVVRATSRHRPLPGRRGAPDDRAGARRRRRHRARALRRGRWKALLEEVLDRLITIA